MVDAVADTKVELDDWTLVGSLICFSCTFNFSWSTSSCVFKRRPVNDTISRCFLFHNLGLPITVYTYDVFSGRYDFGPSSSPYHLDVERCQLRDGYVLQTDFPRRQG